MGPKGGVIDEHAVKAAGGQVLENGVRVGGWTIRTGKAPITTDADCEALKDRLHILTMPEQYYGSNYLRLCHEASGTTLAFTAAGALHSWLQDRSAPVHVEAARDWLRSRQHEVEAHQAKTLEYDWTYTTSYQGDLESSSSASSSDDTGAAQAAAASSSSGKDAATAGRALPRWQVCLGEGIDRGMLMSRDPILFFDELPLYESELEDHGCSQVSVKVRVMPKCWFVLLRFYLRVDHVLVRLREARIFCRFDKPELAHVVLREVKHHEGSFAELAAGGAPPEGPAYADADAAAAALMATAPVGVKLYRVDKLVLY